MSSLAWQDSVGEHQSISFEGTRRLGIGADVTHKYLREVLDGGEDAASDDFVAPVFANQISNLIELGRIGGGEVEFQAWSLALRTLRPCWSYVWIGYRNHMNLLTRLAGGDHLLDEPNEFCAGVPLKSLALNLARPYIQRCVKGQRSGALVFKAAPPQAAGRQRKH